MKEQRWSLDALTFRACRSQSLCGIGYGHAFDFAYNAEGKNTDFVHVEYSRILLLRPKKQCILLDWFQEARFDWDVVSSLKRGQGLMRLLEDRDFKVLS